MIVNKQTQSDARTQIRTGDDIDSSAFKARTDSKLILNSSGRLESRRSPRIGDIDRVVIVVVVSIAAAATDDDDDVDAGVSRGASFGDSASSA